MCSILVELILTSLDRGTVQMFLALEDAPTLDYSFLSNYKATRSPQLTPLEEVFRELVNWLDSGHRHDFNT